MSAFCFQIGLNLLKLGALVSIRQARDHLSLFDLVTFIHVDLVDNSLDLSPHVCILPRENIEWPWHPQLSLSEEQTQKHHARHCCPCDPLLRYGMAFSAVLRGPGWWRDWLGLGKLRSGRFESYGLTAGGSHLGRLNLHRLRGSACRIGVVEIIEWIC